eukprot:gnl/Chilomastix_caulleri/4586.p2 GENE.gnl/Chilomastix_caulleri/4586~~gnl/Chilomastix_caulleri/4586.p2  ORF type:complete len:74 (+),score=12.64 gnl/Chilomastix_caulleri/4586:212-433(+)
MKMPRNQRSNVLRRRIVKDETLKNFQNSAWGKKLQQREIRRNLTEFQRYRVSILKRVQRRMRKVAANKRSKGD